MKTIATRTIVIILLLSLVSIVSRGQEPLRETVKISFKTNMHCEGCKKKVEDNLAFEKGVTSLDVNLEKNIVTIEYKPWKNDSINLRKSIEKLGYTAVLLPMEVKDKGKEQKEK